MFRNKNWKRCFEGQRVWLRRIKHKFLSKEPQLISIFNRSFRQKFSKQNFCFVDWHPNRNSKNAKFGGKKWVSRENTATFTQPKRQFFRFPMQGTNYNIFVRIFKQKLSAVELVGKLSLVVSGNKFGILTGKKHDWKSPYFRLPKD